MAKIDVAYCQPDPDYRSHPAEAQSYIKHILKSPAHYIASKEKKWPATPNMEIGTAVHCMVLEGPDTFDSQYIMKPANIKLNTKEGQAWKKENQDRKILSNSDTARSWDTIIGISSRMMQLPEFRGNQPDYRKFNEVSIYWESEEGISCKARLDRVVVAEDYVEVIDIKTTDSVDPKKFNSKVHSLNYLFQAGWYGEAAQRAYNLPPRFKFVAVEREPPYTAAYFPVSEDMMSEAMSQCVHAREILKGCQESGSWAEPEVVNHPLKLPDWYISPVAVDCQIEDPFA